MMEVRRRGSVNVAERDRSLVGRSLAETLTRVQRRHEGVRIDCQDVYIVSIEVQSRARDTRTTTNEEVEADVNERVWQSKERDQRDDRANTRQQPSVDGERNLPRFH